MLIQHNQKCHQTLLHIVGLTGDETNILMVTILCKYYTMLHLPHLVPVQNNYLKCMALIASSSM